MSENFLFEQGQIATITFNRPALLRLGRKLSGRIEPLF
jgi:hypothetical protein